MPNSPEGLELARLADLPPEVLTEARRVAERLSEMEAERREASRSTKVQVRRKAMLLVTFLSSPWQMALWGAGC